MNTIANHIRLRNTVKNVGHQISIAQKSILQGNIVVRLKGMTKVYQKSEVRQVYCQSILILLLIPVRIANSPKKEL